MPELPEVECVKKTLAPIIEGKKVISCKISLTKMVRPDPIIFEQGILKKTVQKVDRHGKLLILHLNDGTFWTIHLGMTGQLLLNQKACNQNHVHIKIKFDSLASLDYRDVRQFGYMAYCVSRQELDNGPLKNMGPDALKITEDKFIQSLSKRKAPIKSLLLDQRILAGIGNIYADEALYRAKIAPYAKADSIPLRDLAVLYSTIGKILKQSIELGGSSIRDYVDAKGQAGSFQNVHQVYQKSGQACPCCGATIEKTTLAGRSTHFCPACQKDYTCDE